MKSVKNPKRNLHPLPSLQQPKVVPKNFHTPLQEKEFL